MAAVTATQIRDRALVAILGHSATFSNLSTQHQTDVGNAATEALNRAKNLAQWWGEPAAVGGDLPTVLEDLAYAEGAAAIARVLLGWGESERYRESANALYNQALESYSPDWLGDTFAVFDSVNNAQKAIFRAMVRNRAKRLIPPGDAYRFLASAWSLVWHFRGWRWRRREATITIAVGGTVTVDAGAAPDTNDFKVDSPAQEWYVFDDDSTRKLKYARAKDFYERKAFWGTSTERPEVFRPLCDQDDEPDWHVYPQPDQEYTLTGEVFVKAPALADANIVAMPSEFHPIVIDLAIARAAQQYLPSSKSRELTDHAEGQLNNLGVEFDDVGDGKIDDMPMDVYEDANKTLSGGGNMIGGYA